MPTKCECPPSDRTFGPEDKEKFRTFMRMYENFSGCRVLAYCLMGNHVNLLLEVPPMPEGGLSDAELLKRLRALYNEVEVGLVARELKEARKAVGQGLADESSVAAIRERFTCRMHDLGEFMKTLLARFCVRSAHAMRSGRASSGAPFLMAA